MCYILISPNLLLFQFYFISVHKEVLKLESAASQFKFASYYGSHMVLQRGPIKSAVWGYAALGDVNKEVTITLKTNNGSVIQTLKSTVSKGKLITKTNE